jgi:hypothetical protein
MQWVDIFPGAVHRLEVIERKRLQAVWELFHSELKFLFLQLLVLRNVYQEPLKRCQVEGCLLTVEPDLLFGNLEQLCRVRFKAVSDGGELCRKERSIFGNISDQSSVLSPFHCFISRNANTNDGGREKRRGEIQLHRIGCRII